MFVGIVFWVDRNCCGKGCVILSNTTQSTFSEKLLKRDLVVTLTIFLALIVLPIIPATDISSDLSFNCNRLASSCVTKFI